MAVFKVSSTLLLTLIAVTSLAEAQTTEALLIGGYVLSAVGLELSHANRVIAVEDPAHAESEVATIVNRTNSRIGFMVFLTSANGGKFSNGQNSDLGYQLSYNGQPVQLGQGAVQVYQAPGSDHPKVARHVLRMRITDSPKASSPRTAAYSDTLTLSIVSL